MGTKAVNKVWEHSKQTGSALVLMLAVAEYCLDSGLCLSGPSIEFLANKVRVGRNMFVTLSNELVQSGELITFNWPIGHDPYCIVYGDESNAAMVKTIRRCISGAIPFESLIPEAPVTVEETSGPKLKLVRGPVVNLSVNVDDLFSDEPKWTKTGGKRNVPFKLTPPPEKKVKKGEGRQIGKYFGPMYALCYMLPPGTNAKMLSKAQMGQVAQTLKIMYDAKADLERLDEFSLWWASMWMSKDKRDPNIYVPPRPIQVRENWGAAMAHRDKMSKGSLVVQLEQADRVALGRIEVALESLQEVHMNATYEEGP